MISYPLIKEGQMSHKYAFLRVSRATLLCLGASLKRVNGAIILENGLVPPCSILLRPTLACTGQVFRYDIFRRKATTDTNLVETLQQLLQYD